MDSSRSKLGHGFGLYHNDCRFLNGYELTVAGRNPVLRESNAEPGNSATLVFSNAESQTLARDSVRISLQRTISGVKLTLSETITLQNLTNEVVRFSLSFRFAAHFEDIFAVRGIPQRNRGTLYSPQWHDETLLFRYSGADTIERQVAVNFSPAPSQTKAGHAHFDLELAAKESREISVSQRISETDPDELEGHALSCPSVAGTRRRTPLHERNKAVTQVRTDDPFLNQVLDRSLRDLTMLRSNLGTETYFAAGVPWYATLFGRDSIITALQMLAYDANIAEQTIRLLADYQGIQTNEWRDEEPGKILHELRVGEMAHLNEIPHTPYYGSIDATPLWLILVGRHAAWTGDLRVFDELRPNIEAALRWLDEFGDLDGDGYVEYQCKSEGGLLNQGWKDSNGAIVNRDGSLAEPPIALVEVQAYLYRAKTEIAALFRMTGDHERAAALEDQAQSLRSRFNRDFWSDEGYYTLARGKGKRSAEVLSSNAGQALWCGIADPEKARATANALLAPEMFSGWGIRTLSIETAQYNPNAYHLGSVWPHDNSLIAAGFKHYGLDAAALCVLSGLVDAAEYFSLGRLPELFAGFARETGRGPIPCPIACQPQAWAAAAIPFMMTTILGLEPDGFANVLRIARPTLPKRVNHLEVRNLSVGATCLDLLFERAGTEITVRAENIRGDLEVIVQP